MARFDKEQVRFRCDGQRSMTQTQLHSWTRGTRKWLVCSSSRQEVSCYFTPEFCNNSRIQSQLESRSLVPAQPDCFSIVFLCSSIFLPLSHYCTLSNWRMCTRISQFLSFYFFKLNAPMFCFGCYQVGLVLGNHPSFSNSSMLSSSYLYIPVSYFVLIF